jgi:anti-anti-sigma factor
VPDGRITHAERDGLHVLRYYGRVTYTLAPAIERFVEAFFGDHPLRGIVFDLRDATLLDSTNLGLLARMADRARRTHEARCMIVSNNDDIDDVLYSMGFEETFDIVHDVGPANGDDAGLLQPHTARALDSTIDSAGDSETEIELSEPSQDELRRTMLEAHRALCALNDRDRAEFQDVVSMLEAESVGSPR